MAAYTKPAKKGRPVLDDASITVQIGVKMSKSLKKQLEYKVKKLNEMGYNTNGSELVRILLEDHLDWVLDSYQERTKQAIKKKTA